jgi:hypothetical protein
MTMPASYTGSAATTHKVVLPFYLYAAVSFLVSTALLFIYSPEMLTGHYFHPKTLAVTHTMALGWGTMIILGASYQLVPVLTERELFSIPLAWLSFLAAAVGIPLLVYGFFHFNMGWPAQWGGILVNGAVLAYLVNLVFTFIQNKKNNIHAVFIFTAGIWLFLATLLGLLLLYNFSFSILSENSLHYLPLHAHFGIIGWFLLLVTGVGARLIPLFLISKYDNKKILWIIYWLINIGLLTFIAGFMLNSSEVFYLVPVLLIMIALTLFARYCHKCYRHRLRRQVDEQMKMSVLSVLLMALPFLFLLLVIVFLFVSVQDSSMVLLYGLSVFFGWLTTIILGMTFKTLPFIVWNKIYHFQSGSGETPAPNSVFSKKLFNSMSIIYLIGFALLMSGVYFSVIGLIRAGTFSLLLAALLYNFNVLKVVLHKPVKS